MGAREDVEGWDEGEAWDVSFVCDGGRPGDLLVSGKNHRPGPMKPEVQVIFRVRLRGMLAIAISIADCKPGLPTAGTRHTFPESTRTARRITNLKHDDGLVHQRNSEVRMKKKKTPSGRWVTLDGTSYANHARISMSAGLWVSRDRKWRGTGECTTGVGSPQPIVP